MKNNATAGVILSDHSLVLRGLTRHSAGDYTCLAANSEGKTASNPVTLQIMCESIEALLFYVSIGNYSWRISQNIPISMHEKEYVISSVGRKKISSWFSKWHREEMDFFLVWIISIIQKFYFFAVLSISTNSNNSINFVS